MAARDLAARIRVPLGFAIAGLVLYLATPSAASIAAGLPIALAGLGFRATAAGVIRKDTVLAREGPYRVTRNPLYFGSSLLSVGFALMSGSLPAALLLLAPSALIYPGVIRREEQHLRRSFGTEFDDFRRSVPCFLPRRLGPGILESFSPEQYRSNREYKAFLGFMGATALLVLKCVVGGL